MADLIELRGLLLQGFCGVLPEEQDAPQPIEIDMDVEIDLEAPAASDRLEDTVDYAELVAVAERVVREGRFALLERLAARIADSVMEEPRIDAVTVAVRKLDPPVPQDLRTSGVRMRRSRWA